MFRDRIRHLGLSLALALALLPGLALAQLELSWARPSSGHIGTMLALDGANNVYSVGSTGALATVIKHGPDGTLLWERTLAGASAARGVWVDTDPQGNAVVLINQVSAANNSPIGVIVAKFSPAGDELWRDDLPLSLAYGVRVATDGVGNAYVLGVLPPQGGTSFNALYKYSPAGTRLWAAAQTFRSPLSMVVTPGGQIRMCDQSIADKSDSRAC